MIHSAFPYSKDNQKLFFIGEIGGNHNGSLSRLYDLISRAKDAGCDAVKLQFYDPDRLWTDKSKIDAVRKTAISLNMLSYATERCHENDIAIGCSIFDIDYVNRAAKYMDFLKISSFECLWLDLIKTARQTSKPLFISTGMCTKMEMYQVSRTAWQHYGDALFHCCSTYPVDASNSRIDILKFMINSYRQNYSHIGYSDHTKSPGVIYSAVGLGTDIIECHIDLDDMQGAESQHGHCWRLLELKEVIQNSHVMKNILPPKSGGIDVVNDNFSNRVDRENLMYRVNPATGMRP